MSIPSIVKEMLIAVVTAGVGIPLLWILGASVNPERDVHSPGLDLVVLTLAGAAMVVLLRSALRNPHDPPSDGDHEPEDRTWSSIRDSYGCGQC